MSPLARAHRGERALRHSETEAVVRAEQHEVKLTDRHGDEDQASLSA